MSEKIYIPDLPRTLREHGLAIAYHKIWRAACEGRIPAERQGSRWYVKRDDLPKIVAAFAPVQN